MPTRQEPLGMGSYLDAVLKHFRWRDKEGTGFMEAGHLHALLLKWGSSTEDFLLALGKVQYEPFLKALFGAEVAATPEILKDAGIADQSARTRLAKYLHTLTREELKHAVTKAEAEVCELQELVEQGKKRLKELKKDAEEKKLPKELKKAWKKLWFKRRETAEEAETAEEVPTPMSDDRRARAQQHQVQAWSEGGPTRVPQAVQDEFWEAATQPLVPENFLGSDMRQVTQTMQASFPGAMKGADVMSKLLDAVKAYGLTRDNTIYGQSICADEINSDPGHLTTLLTQYYGRTFPMGGIGGAPYVGKTGFMAFSHHVPDNGHVLIVFGPHIGFSPSGEPGKFLRKGQAAVSTSCGAVIAAYNQITSGVNMPADPVDMEQSWLRAQLKQYCPEVAQSSNSMVDLVMKAYQAVEEEMFAIVNTDYGPGKLILLGGIQINMPYPLPGYFMPLHFSARSHAMAPKDLMSTFQ
uniref:Limiting CO2-inducible protein B/C beta carbonyic anhydrase domain-containing protein n=1 Tax=Pyrodinium bahamense TaxID=73915 RepID=A0A7S0FXW9_9DINO|mmetsp:Transcript_9019/g.25147  ORF Transcript_9019/g.25147 Transcript_9019/m.25147 type:complete len:467 (+) Transcript_9019:34-1434(+)